MTHASFPKWKLLAFALMSAGDFIITYLLLSRSHGAVYESNPVADRWLQQAGWVGLALFKGAIVLVVTGIAIYLYRRRPRVAHDLLAVACGAVVVAIFSGTTIAMTLAGHFPAQTAQEQMPDDANQAPAPDARQLNYAIYLEAAAENLANGRFTLAEAVGELQAAELSCDANWRDSLRRAYPGLTGDALLAADIVQQAVGARIRTAEAPALAQRLEGEFRELYGIIPNLPYQRLLHLAPRTGATKPTRALPKVPVP